MTNNKFVYIETFGCQMNERDSEIMGQLLVEISYLFTSDIMQADLIVINTCSIRAKAEQKVYSLLGRLKKLKAQKTSLIIAVTGCVAQQEGSKITTRMPHVNIVLGTQYIYQLAEMVLKAENRDDRQIQTDLKSSFSIPFYVPSPIENKPVNLSRKSIKKFVTIMQGCNNFCTYCVVPYTRGREISRSAEDIINEIRSYAEDGVKEITLLGQNVNLYGLNGKRSSALMDFPELLVEISKISGIERIRFTTSHPKDLSQDLIESFVKLNKLCPHFHLPVQSGSNTILKLMNRKYTVEKYIEKINLLRQINPDVSITTDIIVGFPGETEEDFDATMELLEEVRFHSAFSFKYSDRPNAKSKSFANKISEEVKSERLKRLQSRQDEITLQRNKEYIGKTLTVMVEGESKAVEGQITGRSGTNHIVNFFGKNINPGDMVNVIIEEGLLHSLRGIISEQKAENGIFMNVKERSSMVETAETIY